jgi:nifR3 family TIM-barrel protein
MKKCFWDDFSRPIIGLAPMDGITDAAFRYVTAKYSDPDVIFTEFTTAQGICAGATRILDSLRYDKIERPVVAQLFGADPDTFYKAAFLVCELGFDGIDINMGCPAKNISGKGAGAALIIKHDIAGKILRKAKEAAKDWAEGRKINDIGLPEEIISNIPKRKIRVRKLAPVSVKTRIGYHKNTVESWIGFLLEESPAAITIHGRTYKQMYSGTADYEAIGKAAEIAKGSRTLILGNGDIKSVEEAGEKIRNHGLDGVLIGRAAMGNPWIFNDKGDSEITLKEKFKVSVEHSEIFARIFGIKRFAAMRKHLAWYCKGFSNAAEIRQKLMSSESPADVKKILKAALAALAFTKKP